MNSQPAGSTATEARRHQRGGARPAQLALLAVAGTLLLYARMVAALGIGEPRELSHLFEPLQVDVPVDARGVEPAAVKVGVSFSGIDPALAARLQSRLHREWRLDPRGQYVLRISADAAIQEPLMQMRVEVGDDRIQAVRELTLLFDPAPVPAPEEAATEIPPAPPLLQPGKPAVSPPAAAVAVRPAVEPRTRQAPAKPAVGAAEPDATPAATAQLRSQALSSADRWLRVQVAAGDTLETLAGRVRGEQATIPLSMVAMLLRWLNPRAFDGIGGQPLVGAELRFPRPESLAAQLAVSDGHWQVDGAAAVIGEIAAVTPASTIDSSAPAGPVPVTPAMTDRPSTRAADPSAAVVAGAALLGPGPTTPAKLPTPVGPAAPGAAGGLLGSPALLVTSLVLASLLAVALTVILRMRAPALQRAESLPGVVVARSLTAAPPESAAVLEPLALEADRFDLASLDLALHRQAEAVARTGASERRGDARS
ncbi:MAG: hypothetical protein C0434_01635 [Xanthomonadaceae bacterium]|nr:hypothetical protein [Xanthomonadaceae bacterium]